MTTVKNPLVFIGHAGVSTEVSALCARLETGLKNKGLDVFYDRQIDAGEYWQDRVGNALYRCAAAILIVPSAKLESGELFTSFLLDEWIALLNRIQASKVGVHPFIHRLVVLHDLTEAQLGTLRQNVRLANLHAFAIHLKRVPTLELEKTELDEVLAGVFGAVDIAEVDSGKRSLWLNEVSELLADRTRWPTDSKFGDAMGVLYLTPDAARVLVGRVHHAGTRRTLVRLLQPPSSAVVEAPLDRTILESRLRAARSPRARRARFYWFVALTAALCGALGAWGAWIVHPATPAIQPTDSITPPASPVTNAISAQQPAPVVMLDSGLSGRLADVEERVRLIDDALNSVTATAPPDNDEDDSQLRAFLVRNMATLRNRGRHDLDAGAQ